ncbi:MAG: xanthine dehydrogenase family protein subunit M [Ignavibacteria bacterium]|nr:xanthine dehydrogenase family protein subunit M [Ignavibacteria bacterium]
MRLFEFYSPRTFDEATALLSQYGADAKIIAGGTDLLIELRKPGAKTPKAIIDISKISELTGIREEGDLVVLNALTTHSDILRSQTLQKHASLLCSAASTIGSPQIRNRGTVGGNIMNAATCADMVPPLIALDAQVTLKSRGGTRTSSLSEFFVKPYVTSARPDEILIDIRFPKPPAAASSSFVKLGRRNAVSISRLSVAAILHVEKNALVKEARIVPGSAFPTWQRVMEAESILVGKKPSRELFAEAGKKVAEVMISITGRRWSTEYKEPVIAVLVRRALEACWDN